MSIIKSAIVWFAVCAVAFLSAIGNVKAETFDSEAAPKFEICLLATEFAINSYKLKNANKKIKYKKVDDIFVAFLMKEATEIGYYKSTSVEDAAVQAFAACADNQIWN